MTAEEFNIILYAVIRAGYEQEIQWQRDLNPVSDSGTFYREASWVILNSGMRNQVAIKIWKKIRDSWEVGGKAHDVFGHKGKSDAIEYIRDNAIYLFCKYLETEDKISYLRSLPWIGPITCYHLAKNLGIDCVKPDRHLVRVAGQYGTTPEALCKRLSEETGEKVCVIDIVLWRACNLKII